MKTMCTGVTVLEKCLRDKLVEEKPITKRYLDEFLIRSAIEWNSFCGWIERNMERNATGIDVILSDLVLAGVCGTRDSLREGKEMYMVCEVQNNGTLASHICFSCAAYINLLGPYVYLTDVTDAQALANALLKRTRNVQLRKVSRSDREGVPIEIDQEAGTLGKQWFFTA